MNGSQTAPAAGVASATIPFTMPTIPGTYIFRFLANDTLSVLATTGSITVVPGTQGPTVTVTPTNAAPGATLNVNVANGPGNVGDWVALHWGWVCEVLAPPALANLRRWTDVHLAIANRTV